MEATGGGVSLEQRASAYEQKVQQSTAVTARNGSAYTAACYVGLYSLLERVPDPGRVAVYSYGSGSVSTLFVLRGTTPVKLGVSSAALLDRRLRKTPEEFLALTEKYARSYKEFGWSP